MATHHRLCLPAAAGWLILLLSGCGAGPESPPATARPTVGNDEFLNHHWQRPLAPQGAPPKAFSTLEASLDPAACGTCHTRQFADWRTSLHSLAASPGLIGQLRNMAPHAVDDQQACIRCHAPLYEQAKNLEDTLAAASMAIPPRPDGASFRQGLTCAGCHVRGNQRFGPPRRDNSFPAAGERLPHNGWTASAAFEDARFCAACHQFESDGPALNGKLFENTYQEWKASRYGQQNQSCQSCHMPDRRHLWRGIHDADMVRSGLDIAPSPASIEQGHARTALAITNTHVGHDFPTYVTPQVTVEIHQQDSQGHTLPGTSVRWFIGRKVSLDLARELSDTRLAPDEVRRFAYDKPLHANATLLRFIVTVDPDAFYAAFYRATLKDPDALHGRQEIRQALQRAEHSSYVLYDTTEPLTGLFRR